jgi:hypothetical protein
MEGNNLEDKRKSLRFPTNLKALYYLSEQKESVEKCRILNVSYKGFGIQFPMGEKIATGANINIGIVVQWQFMPISVKGILKWKNEEAEFCDAGAELITSLDNLTLMKLF